MFRLPEKLWKAYAAKALYDFEDEVVALDDIVSGTLEIAAENRSYNRMQPIDRKEAKEAVSWLLEHTPGIARSRSLERTHRLRPGRAAGRSHAIPAFVTRDLPTLSHWSSS